MSKGHRRGAMPLCSAFIDEMRNAFGAEEIDQQIKRGMRGEPVFWASENGVEIGTPLPADGTAAWPAIVAPAPQAKRGGQ